MKIKQIDYHRNGVSANGFYVVRFYANTKDMIAIVFEEPGNIAVFDFDLLKVGETRFTYNSWRGDEFEQSLRDTITKYENL
jgi:hypothetical protein